MITLKSRQDIQHLYREKNRLETQDLYVVFRRNQAGMPRFLFVASKKIFRKSVERNRVKRLLRQAVRSVLNDYPDLCYDISVIAKKSLIQKKVYDIIPQIKEIFAKLQKQCLVESLSV